MTPEERAQRLLSRLPSILQAGTNFRRLFESMGKELEVMEWATRRLLESRWYKLARGFNVDDPLVVKASSELGSIGALFDLAPGRGESADYFRRHIIEFIRLHGQGLTTARSILELISFVYIAEYPPAIEVNDGIAVGRFKVRENDGSVREIRVELVDNPPSAASARFLTVEANRQVVTENGGLEEAFPEITIRATNGDVAVPLLHQEESGFDVIFLGVIEKEQTLVLRHQQPPLIDGFPTKGVVLLTNPTRFAGSETGDHVFRFDSPTARFSDFNVANVLPSLLPGETRWHYRTMSRTELFAYIGHRADLAQYVDIALEEAESPPVDITFTWTELTPAACELRIPAGYVPPHYHQGGNPDSIGFYRDILAALEYGRAAGIRATMGLTLPLARETVTIVEGPMQMRVDMSFTEQQPSTDELTSIGPIIEVKEQLEAPDEYLTFGGIFNTTYFNNSRFE